MAHVLTDRRSAGILLHPTSLPSRNGCGGLGPESRHFVDFLAEAGQTWWQVLPLTPLGSADSPYASRSAFAGSPLLISPEDLVAMDLLAEGELVAVDGDPHRADFSHTRQERLQLLRRAFARLPGSGHEAAVAAFRASGPWVEPHALFTVLRERDSRSWWEWPRALAALEPAAIERAKAEFAGELDFHVFVQWLVRRQWEELREYARARSVGLIGDLPIFVDHDSVDAWWNRDLFRFDAAGRPEVVTGVPPDLFSATGQRWGNPHYRWDVLADRGYDWWIARLGHALSLFDAVRIDHFRGFAAAWEIPATSRTAINGRWAPGPGAALFEAFRGAFGSVPIVAEDLGVITPDVEELRDSFDLPGMLVLQFAWGGDARNPYLPHNHRESALVYTGTHDNDTTRGWWRTLERDAREHARRYLGFAGDPLDRFIMAAYGSVARLAILPMQDVLGLGSEGRMNNPGTMRGNWRWRFTWDQLPKGRTAWLRDLVELYGR